MRRPCRRVADGREPFSLAGRVALVTGGGGSLGLALGRTFASLGADVILADLDGGRARDAADAARAEHPGRAVEGVEMDVRRPASVTAAFERATEAFGEADVLVTAAGDIALQRFEAMTFEA